VKLFRFGNEPRNPDFWSGTQQQFFETYATWALALKGVDASFILDTPGVASARDRDSPDVVDSWIPALLDYCQAHDVPVDYVSFHTYSIFAPAYYDDAHLVAETLASYPGVSPLYGTPRLANDEWNIALGDEWSGHNSPFFDTAWPAPMLLGGLINMVEGGLELSVPMFGTFNGGVDGCHDFPLVDCDGNPKPAYHAFKGFNQLAGATRLSVSGTNRMNLAAMAGRRTDEILVVVANQDIRAFIDEFEPADSPGHAIIDTLAARYGDATYDQLSLTLAHPPWPSTRVERYVVDATRALELVETGVVTGTESQSYSAPMGRPSVQVLKLTQAP
jgi:xylan 1,4-beta-xylosidase